jgi:hypothetical protein
MSIETGDSLFVPERLVVVSNPVSTNYKRVQQEIEELTEAGWWVEPVHTYPDDERTAEDYYNVLEEGDLTLLATGDGSAGRMHNIRRHNNHLYLPKAAPWHLPVARLHGGNANDTTWMLNGDKRALEVMRDGCVSEAYDIATRLTSPEGITRTHFALGYIGIGATAQASHWIEKTKVIANEVTRTIGVQQAAEAVAAWLAVGNFRKFFVAFEGSEGQPIDVKDVSAFAGNRVAKYGRPDADIFSPEYELLLSNPAWMAGALIDMIKMQQGKSGGELLKRAVNFTIATKKGKSLPIHHDGEVSWIASGTNVTIAAPEEPYYVWATNGQRTHEHAAA